MGNRRLSILVPLVPIILLLSACASPTYKLVYEFEPPSDSRGFACVRQCYQDQKQCLDRCEDRYQ